MTSKLAIGVDLGATYIRAALGNFRSGIIREAGEKTFVGRTSRSITDQIIRLIEMVAGEKRGDVEAIGVGSIGPLNIWRGVITKPSNIPFTEIPLVNAISKEFKVPVYILNDCTTAVLGEKFFGSARDSDNFAYVALSTGIGGGALVDGNLLIGKDGNAVEIGHVVIDFEGKLTCGCGGRGHWEAYCSGRNIPSFVDYWIGLKGDEYKGSLLVKLARKGEVTSELLFKMARNGDEAALEIVEEIGRLNAIGFANVVNAYDPELITVGGGIALSNENLVLKPILDHIEGYAINRVPEIRVTPLREKVVLYGAIALALNPPSILKWTQRKYED